MLLHPSKDHQGTVERRGPDLEEMVAFSIAQQLGALWGKEAVFYSVPLLPAAGNAACKFLPLVTAAAFQQKSLV